MKAKTTVKIDGKLLEALVVEELTNVKFPLIGEILATDVALLTPVGKYPKQKNRVGGRLRGSITWATINKQSEVQPKGKPAAKGEDATPSPTEKLTLWVGSAVEYVVWVELGAGKMKGRFMFTKALKRAKAKINRILAL